MLTRSRAKTRYSTQIPHQPTSLFQRRANRAENRRSTHPSSDVENPPKNIDITRRKRIKPRRERVMPSDENTPLLLPINTPAKAPTSAESNTTTKSQFREALSDIMSASTFWKIGAVYGAAAVGFGAFGAHGLKNRIADPAKIDSWKTAASYQVCLFFPLFHCNPYPNHRPNHHHSIKIKKTGFNPNWGSPA